MAITDVDGINRTLDADILVTMSTKSQFYDSSTHILTTDAEHCSPRKDFSISKKAKKSKPTPFHFKVIHLKTICK
jgi:hypothetical protein